MTGHRLLIGIACTVMFSMVSLGGAVAAVSKPACPGKAPPSVCPIGKPPTCLKQSGCGSCLQWRCGKIKMRHHKPTTRQIPG